MATFYNERWARGSCLYSEARGSTARRRASLSSGSTIFATA
jgi:hypothetical protein